MARSRFQSVVQDAEGDVQPGRVLTLYETDGTTPVAQTLYDAPSGGSIVTTPTTNSLGYVELFTDLPQRVKVGVSGVTGKYDSDLSPDPGDVALKAATQTLSNKTLTAPVTTGTTTFRNTGNSATVMTVADAAITAVQPILATSGNDLFTRMSIGSTVAPSGNEFLVSKTASETTGQLASIEYANTGGTGGDVSSLRVVAYHQGTANNQIRPIETHLIKTSGDGDQPTQGLEITIQGNIAEDVAGFYHNGIRIASLSTTWGVSGGVRQGNGIFIGQDENGFENGILYRGTSAESNVDLFRVNKLGQTFTGAVYLEQGSAAGPTVSWRIDTTTGLFLAGLSTMGISTGGIEAARFDAAGLLDWRRGQTVALGGGSAPTLGTVGGSGPANVPQAGWLKMASGGTSIYCPYWL